VVGRKTVWLVGMMGAGKSAVGHSLAGALELRFVDTDDEVARRANCSLTELFERLGEPGFREREREVIDSVAGDAAVVSLGGGAVAQPGAAERLAASGTVVYLRARPETLLARIGDGASRPLLANLGEDERRARLAALVDDRSAANETAAIVVDTDDASVDEVAACVAQELARAAAEAGRSGGA
jgi:shikimate kinase